MYRWFSLLAAVCIALATVRVHAQAPETVGAHSSIGRCVVWQHEGTALYARLRGHTSDMSLEVLAEESIPIPADATEQRQLAMVIAESSRAALVIWLDAGALQHGRVLLRMALPRQHRYLERDLGAAALEAEQVTVPSAALEAAAVIARESIQAMVTAEAASATDGDYTGTGHSSAAIDLSDEPPSLVTPRGNSTRAEPSSLRVSGRVALHPLTAPPEVGRRNDSYWALALGPTVIADGIGALDMSGGLAARVVRRLSALDLGAELGADLPRNIDSQYGTLRLLFGRLTFDASLVVSRRMLGVSLGVRGGLAVYRRVNLETAQGVYGHEGANHVSGLFGPEARLWLPASSNRLWTELALGMLVPTHVLDIGYQVAGEFRSVATAWPIQPFIQLGIAVAP